MKINTRISQCNKMLYAGMLNLFQSQEVFDITAFSVKVIEILMLLEREEYLKKMENKVDIGNGTYKIRYRALQSNSLLVRIPRTRSGKFTPVTLELLKKSREEVNRLALLLYQKGMSTRDVSYILKDFFGESLSYETVNKLAASFQKVREEWEKQPLDAYYKVIYGDALYMTVKRDKSYTKEAVHVLYGIKEDNTRELVLLEINPTESASVWASYYEKLKARGVKKIDLVVVDGLNGLSDAIHRNFPETDVQLCVVHKMRNVLNKVRPKDKTIVASEIKEVFNNFESTSSIEKAMQKLKDFCDHWGKIYPSVVNSLSGEHIAHYFTYIKYPVQVRRKIYTTNAMENVNRQIRKVTKSKSSFGKTDNLLNFVFMIVKDFEENGWGRHPVHLFKYWKKHN